MLIQQKQWSSWYKYCKMFTLLLSYTLYNSSLGTSYKSWHLPETLGPKTCLDLEASNVRSSPKSWHMTWIYFSSKNAKSAYVKINPNAWYKFVFAVNRKDFCTMSMRSSSTLDSCWSSSLIQACLSAEWCWTWSHSL